MSSIEFPTDQHILKTGIIVCLSFGIIANLIVLYRVFWVRAVHWNACKLLQNIVICDLIHLILMGAYKYLSSEYKFFYLQNNMCKLLYPIFSVTISNPNLALILTLTCYTNRYCKEGDGKLKKSLVGSLTICWMATFFLFTPQVFVDDLTQILQTCDSENYKQIREMRSTYWIGMLYLQIITVIAICIYLYQLKKHLTIHHKAKNLASKRKNDIVGILNKDKEENLASQSTCTTSTKCQCKDQSHQNIILPEEQNVSQGTAESSKISSLTTESPAEAITSNLLLLPSNGEELRKYNHNRIVTFSDTSDSDSCKALNHNLKVSKYDLKYFRNMFWLLLFMTIVQVLSLIPQNIFFFCFHFRGDINMNSSYYYYQTTTVITLLNSVINPFIFLTCQRDLNKWVLSKLKSLNNCCFDLLHLKRSEKPLSVDYYRRRFSSSAMVQSTTL